MKAFRALSVSLLALIVGTALASADDDLSKLLKGFRQVEIDTVIYGGSISDSWREMNCAELTSHAKQYLREHGVEVTERGASKPPAFLHVRVWLSPVRDSPGYHYMTSVALTEPAYVARTGEPTTAQVWQGSWGFDLCVCPLTDVATRIQLSIDNHLKFFAENFSRANPPVKEDHGK